jgi:hypothetical protein
MDVVRSMEVPVAADPGAVTAEAADAKPGDPDAVVPQMTRVALFTEIAVGDAP